MPSAKDHFDVTIRDDGNAVRFVAIGKVEATKEGPFQIFRASNIRMGPSDDRMNESDEDRDSIYSIRDEILYLAANFDREDGDRKPAFYVFEKGTAAVEALLDGQSMVGKWRLELTIQGQNLDYTLMLKKEEKHSRAT